MSFGLGLKNLALSTAFTLATGGATYADAEPQLPNFFQDTQDPYENCDVLEPNDNVSGRELQQWQSEFKKLENGELPSKIGYPPGTKSFEHSEGVGILEPSGRCSILRPIGLG